MLPLALPGAFQNNLWFLHVSRLGEGGLNPAETELASLGLPSSWCKFTYCKFTAWLSDVCLACRLPGGSGWGSSNNGSHCLSMAQLMMHLTMQRF